MRTKVHALAIFAALSLLPSGRFIVNDNVLTGLIPDLFAGLDVVSREQVGFIPSVSRSSTAERAAVNEAVKYPIVPALASFNITPAMAIPEPAGVTVGNDSITISKAKGVEFGFVGEEWLGLNNGPGALSVQANMFAQGLRTLVNEVEADLANAAYLGASRAFGTAGTAPFGTNVGDSAQLKKILDDNGAPLGGRSLIGSTATGASLRTLGQLTKVNEAGTEMTLRDGEILNLSGFSIKESGQAKAVTAGTNNGAASTNNAGYAIGATLITLAAAGTGTILAGDVITFAGDVNKYVVAVGDADVSNGGTITLNKPGLRKAIAASNTVITTGASYTANVGFSADAIQLATRAPALPPGDRDAAIDSMMLTDTRSGLVFEVRVYPGYRKLRYEVALAWGWKVIKTEHTALLLG